MTQNDPNGRCGARPTGCGPSLPRSFRRAAAQKKHSVLLEDACGGSSYLFTDPVEVMEVHTLSGLDDLFVGIDAALQQGRYVAGFLSYEAGYGFEKTLRSCFVGPSRWPLAWFGVYDAPVVFNPSVGPTTDADRNGKDGAVADSLTIDLGEEDYAGKVGRIREWIERGDTYQANLTTTVRWQNQLAPDELLRRILQAQPVEFGALIHLGTTHIVSASPELFFRRNGATIATQPMKGTAARGRTLDEDESRAAWLAGDEKNRAENLMIVDLLRNDLGRICELGSVRATDLFHVSRFPTVFQMTSDVAGTLRDGVTNAEIFHSLFPSGSIVGAPKIRTQQILRELEGRDRGVYTGCIGFFAPGDKAVFSVAIRTIVLDGAQASMGVGSGIVYDSNAADEYTECRTKTRFLTECAANFRLIETLLWNGEFVFLNDHLERLCSSARYFDFAFDKSAATGALQCASHGFTPNAEYRVRLLLAADGSVALEPTPLPSPDGGPVSILIARPQTDAEDRFLFHKTTLRDVYDAALDRARQQDCADAIFFNRDGQLTEGAIHNIILVKDGVSRTPMLQCGLLPGIYRAHLLRTKQVVEAVLTLDDLLAADHLFLCNSVRGMRPVRRILREDSSETIRIL